MLMFRIIVTVLLLCLLNLNATAHSLSSHSDAASCQGDDTLSEAASEQSRVSIKKATAVGQAPVLMQVQVEAGKTNLREILQSRARINVLEAQDRSYALASSATARVVGHMRRFRADPANVAEALTKGISAVQSAFPLFMKSPPEISKGISMLGLAVLDSIDILLTEEGKKDWHNYEKFQLLWKQAFNELPSTADDIKQSLESYSASGNPAELIKAIFDILTEAVEAILNIEMSEIGQEIARFIDAVKDTFTFVGEAVREYEKGDIPASIETTYFGLRTVATTLIPQEKQDELAFILVVGSLDGLVGGLSKDLLDYKRKIVEPTVCWKEAKSRGWSKPTLCPEGYTWDHEKHCWPEMCWEAAADCMANFTYMGKVHKGCSVDHYNAPWCSHDKDFQWYSGWSECVKVPCKRSPSLLSTGLDSAARWKHQVNGTIPARCDPSSKYLEKIGGWCYAECPLGYEADGGRCWTSCSGGVSAEWPLMCGRDMGVLMTAAVEMASAVLHAAFTAATLVEKIKLMGVNVETVAATVDMLIKLSKPFSYSICSQQHLSLA
jgi:hypothetical protein